MIEDTLNLNKNHNALVVMKSKKSLEKWVILNKIDQKFVYKLKGNEYLLKLISDDMDNTYNKMFEQNVNTIEEYTKKNSDDPITRKTYMFFGTAREFKNCHELLSCLQRGFGAGYCFIIGITNGEHKKALSSYYANCPLVINV